MITVEALNPEFRVPRSDIQVGYPNPSQENGERIQSAKEAAQHFEKILVQQFVQVHNRPNV